MFLEKLIVRNPRWLKRLGYFNYFFLVYFSMMGGVLWLEGRMAASVLFWVIGLFFFWISILFIRNAFSQHSAVSRAYGYWQSFSLLFFALAWLWVPIANAVIYLRR